MRRVLRSTALAVLSLLAVVCAASAQSNAEPSLHVSLQPCEIFSGALAASTNTGISIRNICNVPTEATAVELAVTVSGSYSGSLKLWEYDVTPPSAFIMDYAAGNVSSFAVPRLCEPVAECYKDVSARANSAVTLTLVVVGYFAPPQ